MQGNLHFLDICGIHRANRAVKIGRVGSQTLLPLLVRRHACLHLDTILDQLVVLFIIDFHTFVDASVIVVSDGLLSGSSDGIVMLKYTESVPEDVVGLNEGHNILVSGLLVKHLLRK